MSDLIYKGEPAWFSALANLCIILLGLFILAFIAWAVYGTIAARRQAAKDVAELTKGITEKERKALIAQQAGEDLQILARAMREGSSRTTTFAHPAPAPATTPAPTPAIPVSTSPFSPANRGKRRKESSSGISSFLDDAVDGLTDF